MAAMRKWVPRLVLALAIGVALPFLPPFWTRSVGPAAGGAGGLGLSAGVSVGTFAALFFGGILTSLTPCVYPLIPITVSIFGARQAEHRGRSVALSATYVAGIAAMFSALGLFAALSGKAFGAFLSSPAVIAVLATFMVALAASMFGAFEIALPSGLQQRLSSVKAAGFAGAFGMGLVAGIIAAPCTGPVLAGVLTYVATQRNAVLGFWMLFTYAVGMGVLFFVLGATSLRLPRSGPWMETVKSVLGIALVAAAVALVLPFLPRPGSLPLSARSVAAAAGLLGFAGVVAGALSLSFHGGAREKAIKLGALLLLLFGVGLRFGWLGASRDSFPRRRCCSGCGACNEARALCTRSRRGLRSRRRGPARGGGQGAALPRRVRDAGAAGRAAQEARGGVGARRLSLAAPAPKARVCGYVLRLYKLGAVPAR